VGRLVTGLAPVISAGTKAVNDIRSLSAESQANAAAIAAAQQAAYDMQARQNLAMAQLQAQQQMSETVAAQNAALEQERIMLSAQEAEQARRAALKRAVARQKVSLASQGISAADNGSTEAILLGMFQESETDRAARTRMDGLRTQAIGADLAQQRALNILQRSQLAERQRLERELLA
jgi:hypothetical protein